MADALKQGKFEPVDLVVVDDNKEANWFGINMTLMLQGAGMLASRFSLKTETGPFAMKPPSFSVVAVDQDGERLADFFYQRFHIGHGWRQRAERGVPLKVAGLSAIPTDRNTIVIGDKSDEAFVGADGQPGEGLDEDGRPVPAPR